MTRAEIEAAGGLAAVSRSREAEREAAVDAEVVAACAAFPDLAAQYGLDAHGRPLKDQAHRPEVLRWSEHSPGRGPGLAEVAMPAQSAPPMTMPAHRLSTTDARGFLPVPEPRRTTWDVTPETTGSSPLDRRLRAENAELKARLSALEARLNAVAPEPVRAPAAASPEPRPVVRLLTTEEMQRMAYADAKRAAANSDGSGWERLGVR